MTLITEVFPKLQTPKNMVRSMPKRSHFRVSAEKQHGKCPQSLLTFEGQPLYTFIDHTEVNCPTKIYIGDMQNLKTVF